MQAGKMTKRITIQNKTVTQDSELNATASWSNWKTVWAEPVSEDSREFYRLSTTNTEVTKAFRIWCMTGVTAHQRIRLGTEYFEIIGRPINEGERNETLLLLCKAVV